MPASFMSEHSLCRKALVATAFGLGLIVNRFATAAAGPAPDPRANLPGRQVYETYCAACHNIPGTRAPALSALQLMSSQSLRLALTTGVMQQQGSLVPKDKMSQLIEYLATPEDDDNWTAAIMCSVDKRAVDVKATAALTMFGVDQQQPPHECQAGGTQQQTIARAGTGLGHRLPRDHLAGDIVWQYDTLRDFTTINGVKGQGGGIDSHSVFAGSGMLFVASGYGGFRQPPGNVLLAFRPKAKNR